MMTSQTHQETTHLWQSSSENAMETGRRKKEGGKVCGWTRLPVNPLLSVCPESSEGSKLCLGGKIDLAG